MSKADNKLYFRCKCNSIVEATWKPKSWLSKKPEKWVAEECSVCHTTTDLTGIEIIECPHCHSRVIKGEKVCLKCNWALDISTDAQPITCPNERCGMPVYISKNQQEDCTCPYCNTVIQADYIRTEMKKYLLKEAQAKMIALPDVAGMDDRGLVVYKEAETEFPYKSQLLVNEGTYGLMRQNGECQYPLTPGSYLLENSKLSATERFDAAMEGEPVVFITEIFCVVKALPEIRHALRSEPIKAQPVGEAPAKEFTAEASAHIRCTVDDAKAFASRLGYRQTTKAELTAPGSWLQERTQSLVSAAFDQAAREAFEVYAAGGSIYAYKAELTQRVKDSIYSALADDGLSVDSISLDDVKVTETEESAKRQKEYEEKRSRIETVKLPNAQAMRDAGLVIYQHDKDKFEYKSRVQVSEGTYGLLLKNGACQDPLMPGNYLLANCALEGAARFDAALEGQDVDFYSGLLSVIKMLPGFEWYHRASFTDASRSSAEAAREYALSAKGTLRLQVDDAMAFASQFGLRRVSVAELFHAYRPNGQMPSLNAEIEKNYPGTNEDGWLYSRIKSIMNNYFVAACQEAIGERLDAGRMDRYRLAFTTRMRSVINDELYGTGLSVVALELASFSAVETDESKRARQSTAEIIGAAQTEFDWIVRDMELHLKDQPTAAFKLTFRGNCRLHVEDEKPFFALPEVQKSRDAGTPTQIGTFLREKLHDMIGHQLTREAQDLINQERIEHPLDSHNYHMVAEFVEDAINRQLSQDGLRIQTFSVNMPESFQQSKELKDVLALHDKKEKIRRYAESNLALRTDPIRIHLKDDATVYVEAIFAAKAYLRVDDPAVFYETSEVKDFLASEPFVSEQAVTNYYVGRINTLFADIVARVAQAIVDQTNADIRELYRLNGLVQSNLLNAMASRVSTFGMRLDSLDMRMPEIVQQSENLLTWTKRNNTRSGIALQKEIDILEHDKTIFDYDEDSRVTVAKATTDSNQSRQLDNLEVDNMNSRDHVAQAQAEMDKRAAAREKEKADRAFLEKMDQIRKQDELDRLVDDVAAGRNERSFEELRKEYERKYALREMAINQTIREAQLHQQGAADAKAREEQAKFDLLLNAAENKRHLEDILHKIDESNLDWRKKLDEYARLQRKVSVSDQVEIDIMTAEGKVKRDSLLTQGQADQALNNAKTKAQIDVTLAQSGADAARIRAAANTTIQREGNETFLMVGETKIKLATAEAELLETIAQYNEDRRRRMLDHKEDRDERRANLDFEHRMRDRQEAVAQQMELLRQKHEFDLALRDRDDKLTALEYDCKKLVYILNHLDHDKTVQGNVEMTRIRAEEAIKKAEAMYNAQNAQAQIKAEENRLQSQLKADEEAAKRAAEYQKMMADIQLTIEKLRNETERNKDDNQAKVAIAQAQSGHKQEAEDAKRALERLSDKVDSRYKDLQQTMEKITSSQKRIKDRLQELQRIQREGRQYRPPIDIAPYDPYRQPLGPRGGMVYSQSSPNDLSVTGGLGQAAFAPASPVGTDAAYQPAMNPAAPSGMPSYGASVNGAVSAGMPSYGAQPGMTAQPGTAARSCPHCGQQCSAQALICEHCHNSL